jgi:two-component system, OmpR family, phosphate regulon sensor histidine kinase PhoR
VTTSLRTRQFVVYALVVVAALAAATAIETRVQRRWLLQRGRETLERNARQVAWSLVNDPAARAGNLQLGVMQADSVLGCRVTLIARDGRVVADSRADAAALESHADRPEIREAFAGRIGGDVRHSRSLGVDLVYVAVPAAPSAPYAVVRVAEPLAIVRALNASLLRLSLVAAALALLATIALLYWLSGRHSQRVRALEAVASRVGAGDPDARALERPEDELGRLGSAFNRMSEELRERLDALARERDEREQILAHMSDGVALLDGGNRIVHCNHSLAEILGAPRPATPGTPLAEFVRAPEIEDLLRRVRGERRALAADLRLWSPRPRFVRAGVTPLDAAGDDLLLVLHDLTEAETVNRMRQEFVANVSHELRTPLTSLRGYAETLLDGGLEDVEHREQFVRVIRDQAERLQALVDDLLSLAALERPEAEPRRERFDLRVLLEDHVAAERPRATRAGLELALESGPPLELDADRARIAQVVANLLDNALKYTERGGVTVRAGEAGGRAWCEVRDSGPGIPEDDLPRIFERFYRVDKTRSREKGGTGLGLSIVKHVLTLHGGEVSVRSEPGAGSTFRFELPRG